MAGNRAYFAAFILLPTVIAGPGPYITRAGRIVTVTAATSRHEFGCHGQYADGIAESWHRSGRLLAHCESANDIVRPA